MKTFETAVKKAGDAVMRKLREEFSSTQSPQAAQDAPPSITQKVKPLPDSNAYPAKLPRRTPKKKLKSLQDLPYPE